MKLIAYIDGSCYGNPGESGYGVVLQDESGVTLSSLGQYIGKGTNNIAEYRGLLGAIELARSFKADTLHVFSDSELLVRQINGEYKVKQPHLISLFHQIHDMLDESGIDLTIRHIPREKNKLADKLARKAIHIKGEVH
ncbi:ribonuclease HI family protein [bacterium]|nr:ribonuclease HI family protein [bacterium]